MILVDTSVWVDHLRSGDMRLADLLEQSRVLMHPCIVGELACGSLADRTAMLDLLNGLPMAPVAEAAEVIAYIDRHGLHGRGIGFIDIHLLMSAGLAGNATLWTRDTRLHSAAADLGIADVEMH